ncbi:MAG: AAA family ATPase [Pseudomonadota bacterium]
MTAFDLPSGRVLGLTTRGKGAAQLWLEADIPLPPFGTPNLYEAGQPRIHSLRGVVPRLWGDPRSDIPTAPAIKVSVESEAELASLIQWYLASTRAKTNSIQPIVEQGMSAMQSSDNVSNLVLYGPPGTGKTYETARRAVLLCDGAVSDDRAELMGRYNELRSEQRITFVTFHQSYGYEEFVEGLRPRVDPVSKQVVYEVIPGTFKRASDSARIGSLAKPGLVGKPLAERTVCKMSLGVSGSSEGAKVFQYCIENACVLLGWGDEIDFSDCNTAESIKKKLLSEKPDADRPDSLVWYLDFFKNELKAHDIIVVSKGNGAFRAIGEVSGEYQYVEDAPFHQMRAVKWLAVFEAGRPVGEVFEKQFSAQTLYKLNPEKLRFDNLTQLVTRHTPEERKHHVFVIDEINRANISKVFGELITLLEPDKREGCVNALSVKLPYSGEDFSVPSNLHVIGTMNTADRSIALLDTALRRRFDFEELMPRPHLLSSDVDGVNVAKLLQRLNERVESLYDRDHCVGHAFFIGVGSLAELEFVFRRKVLPLLQEYFFEDWAKVRCALNDLSEGNFLRRRVLPPVPMDDTDDLSEGRVIYEVNPSPFSTSAFKRIYESA